MRRLRSRTVAALLLVAFAEAVPSTALAGPGDGSGVGSGGRSDEVISAMVTYTTDGGSGGADGCRWRMIDGVLAVENMGTVNWPRTDDAGVVFHLWDRYCDGEFAGFWEFPEATPRDLLPELLSRLKERKLPTPEPMFEALDPQHGWAYVRVPLDFRAGGNSWRPVSVTASIGPLWATVTATPVRLSFDPGDPAGAGPVTCSGDGPVAPYVPSAPGTCSYTYTNASSTSPHDGYHFQTLLSIDWDISWTSSTGAGGPLAGYSTTDSALLAVAEVQGLVTCTGARPEEGGC